MLNQKEEIEFFTNVLNIYIDSSRQGLLLLYGNGTTQIIKRIKKHLKNVHTLIIPVPYPARFYYYLGEPNLTDYKYITKYKDERLRVIYFELDDELKAAFKLSGYDVDYNSHLYEGIAYAVENFIMNTYKPMKSRRYSFLPASIYHIKSVLKACMNKEDKIKIQYF